MSPVPQAWTDLITAFRKAQVAQEALRQPGASQQLRDQATADYARACDAMVAKMGVLSGDRTLGRITLLLSKKDRT